MGDNLFTGLLMPFLGVLFIIFLAYWGTRWLSKKYNRICTGKYIKILERVALGQDKSLVLMEMAEKTYLLGVSPKGIDAISVFEEGQIKEPLIPENKGGEFPAIFKSLLKKQGLFGKNRDDWHKEEDTGRDGEPR